MDAPQKEVQFLSLSSIFKLAISIPKQSHKTFSLIAIFLIFPLSFATLFHSFITLSLLIHFFSSSSTSSSEWTYLLTFQFICLIFLFTFSLLSSAAVIFTVTSLYTSKPVSFTVFKRLFITFLWVPLLTVAHNMIVICFIMLVIFAVYTDITLLFIFLGMVILILFLGFHVYLTMIWHMGSVASVLENVYGLVGLRKSYELLKGRKKMTVVIVSGYYLISGMINFLFGSIAIFGRHSFGIFISSVVGGLLAGVLVFVNLVWFLVQSELYYYVCRNYHHQDIDKSALYDHNLDQMLDCEYV